MATHRLQAGTRIEPVSILFGYDREIAAWVGDRLDCDFPVDSRSLGFIRNNKIIGGVVFHNYRGSNIEASIASISPRWATKNVLRIIFSYPFVQLGAHRLTALTDAGNQPVRVFLERLGFVHEGTMREAHPEDDAAIYGMLSHECKWITRNTNGQEIIPKSTRRA